MKYIDQIYGEFEITEPVILEIISSPWLQRLKNIDLAGYLVFWPKLNVNINKNSRIEHSRFAHSLGVYLLLKKYQTPLAEQIAGLIHDVSHSAFSHCIDYVLDDGSETKHSHQDNLFADFVRKTEIPGIIRKYGLDLEHILEDKNFPLKEKELPDLCADRIDYSLRDGIIFGELSEKDKNYLLENLTATAGNWVFASLEAAQKYAELFFRLNKKHYAGFSSALMFRTVGDCLKHAMQKGYISEDDLYTDDETVLQKIKKFLSQDSKLELLWERMNNRIEARQNPDDYDAQVFCKSRIVDPLFKNGKSLKRLSAADPNWKKIVKQELKPKQYFLKFAR
jgi:HD superfamily phosphohydrolase